MLWKTLFNLLQDAIVKKMLKTYNIKYSIIIYEIISFSPLDPLITILATKLGISKLLLIIILSLAI